MVVGAIGFVVATVVDYRAIVRLAWLGLGDRDRSALIVARLTGRPATTIATASTYRWLNIGRHGLQPSELVKLMVILVLARMFRTPSQTPLRAARADGPARPLSPCRSVLIAIQPDLGTASCCS